MSRAETICSSAGRPLGLTKFDCVMPSRCAVWFISSAKFSIEPATPSASTTAMSLADLTISILSALSTVNRGADRESHLDRFLRRRVGRDREQLVERDAAFLDRAQRHVGGHELGGGGRIPGNGGVLGVQHLAAVDLDQQQRLGARPRRGETGEGAGDEREDKSSQGSGSGEKLQGHGPLVVGRGNLVPLAEKVSYLGRCGRKCKRVSRSPTRSPKALFMLKENVENSALSGSKMSSR